MTLHWWMHWFWITYHLYVCGCTQVTSPMYSVSSELQKTTFNFSSSNYDKLMEGSTNSPPIITPTAVIFTKISKLLQKQEFYGNLTNLSLVITENPVVKEMTVIGQNFTDVDLNITDSSSFSNTSLITLNHAENVSYVTEEIGMNQSIIVNSERIGVEEQESVKGNLSAAGITGITLGCVSLIGIVCGGIFFVYRNYGSNRPQVLNDHCSNPDSSGYIDDSSVRENSEEMYSLDNDSFLNSLEAMTIQNLWTDTVKHTKL